VETLNNINGVELRWPDFGDYHILLASCHFLVIHAIFTFKLIFFVNIDSTFEGESSTCEGSSVPGSGFMYAKEDAEDSEDTGEARSGMVDDDDDVRTDEIVLGGLRMQEGAETAHISWFIGHPLAFVDSSNNRFDIIIRDIGLSESNHSAFAFRLDHSGGNSCPLGDKSRPAA